MKKILIFCAIYLTINMFLIEISKAGFYGGTPTTKAFRTPYYNKPSPRKNKFVRVNAELMQPLAGDILDSGVGICASCCACDVEINVDSLKLKDVYENIIGGSIEFGNLKRRDMEFSLGFLYLKGSGNRVKLGNFGGLSDVYGSFTDYEEKGIYITGRKKYLRRNSKFYPYVFGRAGLSLVDSISGSFKSQDGFFDTGDLKLFDDSLIFRGSIGLGLGFLITKGLELGGEVGIGYQTPLEDFDSELTDMSLTSINDGSGILTLPVRLYGKFMF